MSFVPFYLLLRLVVGNLTMLRGVALVSLLISSAGYLGCKNADTPHPATERTKARSNEHAVVGSVLRQSDRAAGAGPANIVVGPDFQYDPGDRLEGYAEFVTIRLGNDLRIFRGPGDWCPATLALLDGQNKVLSSFRLDLPPVGAISGKLPDTAKNAVKIRLVHPVAGLTPATWERRIGVPEPELTADRMEELYDARHPDSKTANTSITLSSHEAGLDANFASIQLISDSEQSRPGVNSVTSYTACLVADHMRSQENKVSDEDWVSPQVRNVFNELRKNLQLSKAAAAK